MTQGVLLVNKLTSRRRLLLSSVQEVSGPDGANIVLGALPRGFSVTPPLGSCDNIFPEPPDVNPLELIRLVQNGGLDWDLRFDSTVGEFAWTSLTLNSPLSTVILLSADNTSYLADNFGQSVWEFAASADCWAGLASGVKVTAVFA